MSCISFDFELPEFNCESRINTQSYTVKGLTVYKDGKIFGDVIKIEGNILTVKVDNGNRYMRGMEVNMITND